MENKPELQVKNLSSVEFIELYTVLYNSLKPHQKQALTIITRYLNKDKVKRDYEIYKKSMNK